MSELLALNDLELFDSRDDPAEMRTLALDVKGNAEAIMATNGKLNALIQDELGADTGSYLPPDVGGWNHQVVVD
jgi:hypothetical protein